MSPMRILIIEDDREAAAYLVKAFREAGHAVDHAADGVSGYDLAQEGGYDVAIVDRMLPKMDGLSLIGALRAQGGETPALILSALGQVDDRVKGLRAGGDDYLAKPYVVLRAAGARRGAGAPPPQGRAGGDGLPRRRPRRSTACRTRSTRAGEEIALQPREFRLLEYLMQNAGKVVTRTMLLEHVWDYHFDPQTNVIDVHVSRLRAKIDRDFDAPLLHTVRGAGYMMRDDRSLSSSAPRRSS